MIQMITTGVLVLSVLMLAAAAIVGVAKIVRGPTSLDRIVAADLMVAVTIGAVGLWTVFKHTETLLPVILLLSLFGYTGASAVARLLDEKREG